MNQYNWFSINITKIQVLMDWATLTYYKAGGSFMLRIYIWRHDIFLTSWHRTNSCHISLIIVTQALTKAKTFNSAKYMSSIYGKTK